MSVPSLFDPIDLPRSAVRLSNRLAMAPMPTFAANGDGSVGAEELAYYARRAPGLGAVITAGCAVSEAGICFEGQWRGDGDDLIPSLRAVVEATEPHAVPILQLCHGGSLDGHRDAATIINDFADAARRAKQAGFQAVEIHGGHRYLIHQFFSRRNRRRSNWGGPSVADRVSLPIAIVESCLRHLPCWYRLDPEEDGSEGISFDETVELVQRLSECGVSVFDVSAKRYSQGSILQPDDRRPRAAMLASELADRALVMAVGGIETTEQAIAALQDGCALIGLGSVLLAHPDWPTDVRAGLPGASPNKKPSSDTLVALAVPTPVVDYLAKRGRLRDAN